MITYMANPPIVVKRGLTTITIAACYSVIVIVMFYLDLMFRDE